ncbi:type I pantothenate kinase [Caldiplasma sukawensis]
MEGRETLHTPYVTIERDEWKKLKDRRKINLTEDQLASIRGLNENLDMIEVSEVYAPLSRLLKVYYDNYMKLTKSRKLFLGMKNEKIPYILGIAGSVAVGKSTTARLIKKLIEMWEWNPRVYIVTTDGFLYPNKILEERGLMNRKGFPETYDLKNMIRFLYDAKSGVNRLEVPVYSHLTYDIVKDEKLIIEDPDIIIFEGLNVLQPHNTNIRANGPDLMVSDFFDFSIYIDAEEHIIKKWFIERFFKLKKTAFTDERSYFRKYANISDEEALRISSRIWDEINGKNLKENIERTRYHARLIMEKTENHKTRSIMMRKI